jgi:hypothetical protein
MIQRSITIQPIRMRYNHDTRCFGIQSKIHTVTGVFILYVSHDTSCFRIHSKIRTGEGVFVLYHDMYHMFCRIPTTLVSIVGFLDIVHYNVWGPSHVLSILGYKYCHLYICIYPQDSLR